MTSLSKRGREMHGTHMNPPPKDIRYIPPHLYRLNKERIEAIEYSLMVLQTLWFSAMTVRSACRQ